MASNAVSAAVINSVNSSSSVSLPQFSTTTSSLTTLIILVAVIVACVGMAVLFQYYKWHESPWWSDRAKASSHLWDWMDSLKDMTSLNFFGSMKDIPSPVVEVPEAPLAPPAQMEPLPVKQPAWCFIGEDLTGRYCVKVPSANACDRDRVFNTEQDCELQAANHMPAGVVMPNNGTKQTPLVSGLLTP